METTALTFDEHMDYMNNIEEADELELIEYHRWLDHMEEVYGPRV